MLDEVAEKPKDANDADVLVGRRVRALSWGASTVLVALTGLPEEEARRRTAEARFDPDFGIPPLPS